MGVTSLWTILQPCARPTPLPTLNGKRLAVDASIWIYQFLKAVRDKEGNALRNSHVVGFFRRICKLLFFGIKPVFVFDGGAPVLKRQTVLGRKKRREGRREDAVRTAGRLLAVQMQRRGEEEVERRKRDAEHRHREPEDEDRVPEELVYVDEIGMSAQERLSKRKFTKKDAYHLPALSNGIEGMGQPNDPRIMSQEELQDYARQFHNGEDVNLYDFSKIDFSGDFFCSLPAGDRYNILNAARLRSRLRMGLSKEQLEDMFPDRMAFSRFQIERVKERNELTQRLMNLNGMNGVDVTTGGRIAGERGREYVLVRNEGVEGGWALGVVSMDKTAGEQSKPIDVDAEEKKQEFLDEMSEDEFEDVPVEGLNRLPKITRRPDSDFTYSQHIKESGEDINTLFVDDNVPGPSHKGKGRTEEGRNSDQEQGVDSDEEDHLAKAIALSLQTQHDQECDHENEIFENVTIPEYKQKAVEAPRPIANTRGSMVAHIVNNRANAAIPKRKAVSVTSSSDSEMDLQSALKKARRDKGPERRKRPAPVASNIKNTFDGPLPFEKLDFGSSIFGKKVNESAKAVGEEQNEEEEGENMLGGFMKVKEKDTPRPLPPWLAADSDIREQVREQKQRDLEVYSEDKDRAFEVERRYQKAHGVIEIESSDDGSDVEVLHEEPLSTRRTEKVGTIAENIRAEPPQSVRPSHTQPFAKHVASSQGDHNEQLKLEQEDEWSESDNGHLQAKSSEIVEARDLTGTRTNQGDPRSTIPSALSEPILPLNQFDVNTDSIVEEVEAPDSAAEPYPQPNADVDEELLDLHQRKTLSSTTERRNMSDTLSEFPAHSTPALPTDATFERQQAEIVADLDFDDFSDPEEEELLAQLAVEAEEHARFASTLNNKSERENHESYEKELKALRSQQKKDRRDADEVSHIMITECQALLRLFGIPYITAPMEAEAQCAELVGLGLVDGIVTDDSDIFLFGGTRVYKNMFNSNKFVECYVAADVEKELSLSRDQLISIAHLLGSDYTEGLAGVGPVTAVEIISEFPSPTTGLQDFATWWAHVQSHLSDPIKAESSTFRKKFRRAQATKLFLPPTFPSSAVTQAYLHPDVDSTPEPFQWGVPDLDALRDFLMVTIGWSQERTDEVLVPVIRDMNRREAEGTQSNITRFFEGGVGAGARREGADKEKGSRRMKEAVGRLKAKAITGEKNRNSLTMGKRASEWAKREDERAAEGTSVHGKQVREKGKRGKGEKEEAPRSKGVNGEAPGK